MLYHTLCGNVSPVLTVSALVNWKGQIPNPHRIATPQPIAITFVTGD